MPTITRAVDLDHRWVPSTYDAAVMKVTLYDGRANQQGRTLLSRCYSGHVAPHQWSTDFWDIFVLSGDLEVNGERLDAHDHYLCYPDQDVAYTTRDDCEMLIFVRTNHFWSAKTPKPAHITRQSEWCFIASQHEPQAQKVDIFDGRRLGRSFVSQVGPKTSAIQRSDKPWEMFLLEGDLSVNREPVKPKDHVLCLGGEDVRWFTEAGCTALILVRSLLSWCERCAVNLRRFGSHTRFVVLD